MRYHDLFEGKQEKIKNLKPDTVLDVFHGSNMDTIIDMIQNGIDGRTPIKRSYPHYISTDDDKPEIVNRGLFIGPNLNDAKQFGKVVIKFPVLAKNIYSIFPKPDNVKKDDEFWKTYYPNSFRPSVSAYLDGTAWRNEPQGLFRGMVSPRAIKKVYLDSYFYKDKFQNKEETSGMIILSPDEFKEKFVKSEKDVLFEPQEKINPNDYINRVSEYYEKDSEFIEEILKELLQNAHNFEQQIRILMNPGGGGSSNFHSGIIRYSIAKKLIIPMLNYFDIEKKQTISQKERYHGY